MPKAQSLIAAFGLLGTLVALLYQPIYQRAVVLGFLRSSSSVVNSHSLESLRIIPDTIGCEDLHHHRPSNQLFTACQDDSQQHLGWFPGCGSYSDPARLNTGSITIVDPVQFTSKKLRLKGFKGPFITHGIDIWSSPNDPQTVYIFAINHLPNPLYYDAKSSESASPHKARSQIELFKHVVGSDDAEFLRTIRHPLIETPNDIVAVSPTAFYVTNDHYYREGNLRALEDGLDQQTAPWANIVFVKVDSLDAKDADSGVKVSVALKGMHNCNGLGIGHPENAAEIDLVDASGGVMHRLMRSSNPEDDPKLQQVDSFQLQTTLDNPTYYVDDFATKASNASGYVLAGLTRACDLAELHKLDVLQPGTVWHLRRDTKPSNHTMSGWTPQSIFQDDGRTLRTATTAVLIGIDPKENKSKKQGWLFVTGFLSDRMVAAKVDL